MPKKTNKQPSCGQTNNTTIGGAAENQSVRIDSRVSPEDALECRFDFWQITDNIRNSENAILLDIQSQAKIWNLITPILDEKAKHEGDFQVGGRAYSEIKKDMTDLSARIQRNALFVKKIVELFSSADSITCNNKYTEKE